MKYKVDDKVRIKSLDWYYENMDEYGDVPCGEYSFENSMASYCGNILTIIDNKEDCYLVNENLFRWTDEMIEGLVEETKSESKFNIGDIVYSKTWQRNVIIKEILPSGFYAVGELCGTGWFKSHEENLCKEIVKSTDEYTLPEGYIFKDEHGNVINTTKIVLEKNNDKKENFLRELSELLNKYSIDSKMDMPDYLLADYIWRTLFVNE